VDLELGSKLSELEVTNHRALTLLPTDVFPESWTGLRILNLEKNALGKGALGGVMVSAGNSTGTGGNGSNKSGLRDSLTKRTMPPLFEALAQLKTLYVLQLRGNGFTDEHISEGLSAVG
jgi:hypothetical protein